MFLLTSPNIKTSQSLLNITETWFQYKEILLDCLVSFQELGKLFWATGFSAVLTI